MTDDERHWLGKPEWMIREEMERRLVKRLAKRKGCPEGMGRLIDPTIAKPLTGRKCWYQVRQLEKIMRVGGSHRPVVIFQSKELDKVYDWLRGLVKRPNGLFIDRTDQPADTRNITYRETLRRVRSKYYEPPTTRT